MEFDLYSFQTCKYTGEDNNFFTSGKEYGIVFIGTCSWICDGKVFGVFLTTDEYVGDDIDFCMFYSWKCFNQDFSHSVELDTRKRSLRRYTDYVKTERKINAYRNKKGSKRVENYLNEHNRSKLLKWKIKCDCEYCQFGRQHSNKKRELTLIEEQKAFDPVCY